jgi:two-component sensor histidine kinase
MKVFGGRLFYVLAILVVSINITAAQNKSNSIDSLLKKAKSLYNTDPRQKINLAKLAYANSLKSNIKPTEIECLNFLVYFYLANQDYKNADFYAQQGSVIVKDIRIDSLAGYFWFLKGYLDHVENNYESAVKCYQQAIIYYSNKGFEKKRSNTYLNIGICEMKLSQFETANFYYFKSADLFVKLKDTLDLSANYNSIGMCYLSLKNFDKALFYHKKAYSLRKKLDNKVSIAQSENNIGYAYNELNQPDSAIFYLTRSVSGYKNEKDSSLLISPLLNFSESYGKKGYFKRAERYITRSLQIASKYNIKEELAQGNLTLAELYLAQKKYKEALAAASVTINTAKTLKLSELLMNAYADEYSIYLQKGDYKNALYYDNEKDKLKDSIFSIAKDKAINELEIKYQTNLKEKDIIALNLKNKLQSKTVDQQKLSIIVLIIGAALLALLFIIAYNNYRIKDKANIHIQHLMQELHHRVKNNLQILSGLFTMQIEGLNDEATKNALRENETRLASMNLIHNKLYLDHGNTKIEMEEYLTKLLHHIKESFDGGTEKNINLRLEVEPVMIEADKAVAIGLIVNELATNAFKYAFCDNKAGEIYLGLKQEGKSKILLSLSDNGKGFSDVHKEKEVSFGLKLVNLMARQLGAVMKVQNNGGVLYQLEISL